MKQLGFVNKTIFADILIRKLFFFIKLCHYNINLEDHLELLYVNHEHHLFFPYRVLILLYRARFLSYHYIMKIHGEYKMTEIKKS